MQGTVLCPMQPTPPMTMKLLKLQVRKSFFNDLSINNNVTVVDLLYQQFFTGSETKPTLQEQVRW